MNKAIFILGMHRSGTSALARVVNLLGANLGSQLMQGASDNPKGFFEHEAVVQLHEQLLTELGLSWKDSTPLPENWLESDAADRARRAIEEIVDSEFKDSSLWALKDPRQCRFMALWLPLLEERGIQPHFIIAYRHPLEVAASLAKRGDMPTEPALSCWLSYTLEALLSALDYPYHLLSYDDLMDDWRVAMAQASENLSLKWPVDLEEATAEIDSFLSPELRHHRLSDAELPELIEQSLAQLKNPNRAAIEELYAKAQSPAAAFAPLLQESRLENLAFTQSLEASKKEAAAAEAEITDLKAQFLELQTKHESAWERINQLTPEAEKAEELEKIKAILMGELDSIYDSKSWKLTEPLRHVSSALAKRKKME